MAHFTIARLDVDGLPSVWAARSADGITNIVLRGGRAGLTRNLPEGACVHEGRRGFEGLRSWLGKYARGARIEFRERLAPSGTEFQRRVWRAIGRIPWGETRSYRWVAAQAGRPRAVRAAANACGANPLPVVIPCHRVIASDGGIGGFTGGIGLKRELLGIEGTEI